MNYTQNEKIEQVTDSTMVVGVDIEARYIMQELLITEDANLQNVFFLFITIWKGSILSTSGLRHLRLRIKDCSSDRLRANRSLLVCVCEVCK